MSDDEDLISFGKKPLKLRNIEKFGVRDPFDYIENMSAANPGTIQKTIANAEFSTAVNVSVLSENSGTADEIWIATHQVETTPFNAPPLFGYPSLSTEFGNASTKKYHSRKRRHHE